MQQEWGGMEWDGMGQDKYLMLLTQSMCKDSGGFAIRCYEERRNSIFCPLLPCLDGAVSHRKEGQTCGRWMLLGISEEHYAGEPDAMLWVQSLQTRCFLVHVQARIVIYINVTEVLARCFEAVLCGKKCKSQRSNLSPNTRFIVCKSIILGFHTESCITFNFFFPLDSGP